MSGKPWKETPCIHNDGVVCDVHNCETCGWNPDVEKKRKEAIMGPEKLYRIPFTGYCEVWAKSKEEADAKAENIELQFFAHYEYGDPVCVEKEDENELD